VTADNDMTTAEQMRQHLTQGLALPADAVAWLLDLWGCIQTLDDYADGDPVGRPALDALIWRTLVGMPGNAWFLAHAGALLPAVAQMVLKWQASDAVERSGNADARSFVWRAGYYDVVLMAVLLAHGPDAAQRAAHLVLSIYGERLEDYLAEFKQEAKNA
jgi:hypothetical protein